jgi:hypothetical protein
LQEELQDTEPAVASLCRQLELSMPALTYDENAEINAGVSGT